MTVGIISNGNQTVSAIGSIYTLASVLTPGSFQLALDVTQMQLGDEIEVRVYLTVAGNERLAYIGDLTNQQLETLELTPVMVSPTSWRATLQQTAGTPRDFPWEIWAM